jgi:hypothetical protein
VVADDVLDRIVDGGEYPGDRPATGGHQGRRFVRPFYCVATMSRLWMQAGEPQFASLFELK